MATANSIVKLFTGLKKTGMNTSQIATQISNLFKTNRKIYGRLTPKQEQVFTKIVQENPEFINRIGNPESKSRIANQMTKLFEIPESKRRIAPGFKMPNRGRNIRFQMPQFQMPNRGRNIRFRSRERRQPNIVMGYPVLPPITRATVRALNNIQKPVNNGGPKPPLPPPKPVNNGGPKPPKNIGKKQMDDIIREQLNKLRNATLTEKGRGYGRLLINLPINHPMRTNVKTRILEEVRKAERMRPTINAARLLQNLKSNLGPIKNKNITNRINLALKRLEENARYTRRPSWSPMNMFGRGPRFLPPQLAKMFGYPEPPRAPRHLGINPYPPPPPPPPQPPAPPRALIRNFNALPPAQKNAVQQTGGINNSIRIIQNGGGPQEVAKAAEALNEFPNAKQAMEIKNVKPAAIAAVKAIGTPNRAMNVVNAVTNMNANANVRVSPTPVNKKAPQPIRVKLMKEIIKRLTKEEIIQLVGESSLGNKKANSKNELVKNFTKFVRRQPKKKRSVAGSNNGGKV
jgi:hypothetical protein